MSDMDPDNIVEMVDEVPDDFTPTQSDDQEICPRCGRCHGVDGLINEHINELIEASDTPKAQAIQGDDWLDDVLDGLNTFYVEAARPYDPKDRDMERFVGLKPSEAKAAIQAQLDAARLDEVNKADTLLHQESLPNSGSKQTVLTAWFKDRRAILSSGDMVYETDLANEDFSGLEQIVDDSTAEVAVSDGLFTQAQVDEAVRAERESVIIAIATITNVTPDWIKFQLRLTEREPNE